MLDNHLRRSWSEQMVPTELMEQTVQMEQMAQMAQMARTVQKLQMAPSSSTQALARKASQRTTVARWLCSLALVSSRYG